MPLSILEEGLAAAARGRATLLDAMERAALPAALGQPQQRPPTAPAFGSVRVPQAMLGRIIGPGGSTIRELESAFEARVDIDDSGGCGWGGGGGGGRA